MTELSGEQTVTEEYVYNGNGQRSKKVVNGQTTLFFFNKQGKLIAEQGAASADYFFLNGNPFVKAEGANVYFYHNDHLGTPLRMTDGLKQVVWSGEFKPFGEGINLTSTITNNLRFPGQYYDSETDLAYNYFRDYNSVIGRYVEADTIGIKRGENHLYTYVQNNPIVYKDAKGLSSKTCADEYEKDKLDCDIEYGNCMGWFNCKVWKYHKCTKEIIECKWKAYFKLTKCLADEIN